MEARYDCLVVGSGAGGATLARELARRGTEVLVVERGRREASLGTFPDAMRFYDRTAAGQPTKSREGVILWRTAMAGGATVVSCGSAVRSLERELAERGIALDAEFAEAERELGVAPMEEGLLSEGTRRIARAAEELGYGMEPMPKLLAPSRCDRCGQCTFGCRSGAKWTALDYLAEAERNGARVLYGTTIERVLFANGRVRGVLTGGEDATREILARTVVLAAGGLGTPVILQRSGIEAAGRGLSVDLRVNTYGSTHGLHQMDEPAMALVDLEFHRDRGFLLSPYVNHSRMVRAMEFGPAALGMTSGDLIGLVTVIRDEPSGRVHPNGTVSKPVTEADRERLREGARVAGEILAQAGAEPHSLRTSAPQGAHPAGTAAIGRVVDSELQTAVDNLFVCDASVLPEAPGLPPILTIVALAKRLAKTLAGDAPAA